MSQFDLDGKTLRRTVSLELTVNGGGFFLLQRRKDEDDFDSVAVDPIAVDKIVTRFDLASMNDEPVLYTIAKYLVQFEYKSIYPCLDPFGKNLGKVMWRQFNGLLRRVNDGDPAIGLATTDGIPLGRISVTHGDAVFKVEPKLRIDNQVNASVANETSNVELLWEANPRFDIKEFFWHLDTTWPSKRFHRGKKIDTSLDS